MNELLCTIIRLPHNRMKHVSISFLVSDRLTVILFDGLTEPIIHTPLSGSPNRHSSYYEVEQSSSVSLLRLVTCGFPSSNILGVNRITFGQQLP